MISLSGFFANGSMTIRGNYFFIYIAKSQYRQRHIIGILRVKKPRVGGLISGFYHQ